MLNRPLMIALGCYYLLALLTFSLWEVQGRYPLTGDEPHYLVMSQGLLQGHLEQTAPYQQEFRSKSLYPAGLAPADAIPSPVNTHAVQSSHGLFNVHNIGLPLLLAIPLLLGGITGVKLFMLGLSGLAVMIVWQLSGLYSNHERHRLWATLALILSMPLLPAATQIYPDLLAGVIALGGLYWLLSTNKTRCAQQEAAWMLGLVFLPWLQIKFGPTTALLVMAILYRYWQQAQYQRALLLAGIAVASLLLLITYNQYAFDNPFGPYSLPPYNTYSVEISLTSLMVFLGLHLDQNQGFLLQNPLLWVGVYAIGLLFRHYRVLAWWWLAVYVSLLIPNAIHPVWYGGTSFSGRFEWAAALVFYLPALYGLLRLAQQQPRIFYTVIIASLLLQTGFYSAYTFGELDLYRKTQAWLFTYPAFYPSIYTFVPFFGDVTSFWKNGINQSWLTILIGLLIVGFSHRHHLLSRARLVTGAILCLLILLAGRYLVPEVQHTIEFRALYLPSATGRLADGGRLVESGVDTSGYVTFGPYIELPQGNYTATLYYFSTAPATEDIGNMDIYSNPLQLTLANHSLKGSAGQLTTTTLAFILNKAYSEHPYEIRSFWNGIGSLAVNKIVLTKVN